MTACRPELAERSRPGSPTTRPPAMPPSCRPCSTPATQRDELADRFAGAADLRHRRPARAAAGRPERDEHRAWSGGPRPARPRSCRRPDHAGAIVVIGYDGRHRSQEFAQDSARCSPRPASSPAAAPAAADAGAGLRGPAAGAAAGVMVTASHNPPQDNGYKVYAADGAQIVPPMDSRDRGPDPGGRAPSARSRCREDYRCWTRASSRPT